QREARTGVGLSLIEHRDVGSRIKLYAWHHCHRRHIQPVTQIEPIRYYVAYWTYRSAKLLRTSSCNLFPCHMKLLSGHGQIPFEILLYIFIFGKNRAVFSADSWTPSSIECPNCLTNTGGSRR